VFRNLAYRFKQIIKPDEFNVAYSIYAYFDTDVLGWLDAYPDRYPILSRAFEYDYERIPVNNELFSYIKPRGDDGRIKQYLNECLHLPYKLLLSLSEDKVSPSSIDYERLKKLLSKPEYTALLPLYKENR
jgi:hypothetical protein